MKRTIIILMALAIVLSLVCGCTSQPDNDSDETQNVEISTESQDTGVQQPSNSEPPTELTAELIATIKNEWRTWQDAPGGIIFEDANRMWGIMSVDGTIIGDAKYVSCSEIKENFQVATKHANDENVHSFNRFGVVNAAGEELIPLQYAYIRAINDRYYYVGEITEQTENRDEALLYGTDFLFEVPGQDPVKEGDILFKGNWYIYDIITGKVVEGATGTKPYATHAYGKVLEYYTDEEKQVLVNEKNEKLPEGITMFENGCYLVKSDEESSVCDSNGDLLFTVKDEELTFVNYTPTLPVYEEYLVVKNPEQKSLLLDLQGNVASTVFDNTITGVYGTLILAGGNLYDFSGKLVYEGDIDYVVKDQQWGKAWLVRDRNQVYTMINENGTALCQTKDVETDKFAAYVTKEAQTIWYCMADKDFTVEGTYAVGPWLVSNATDTVHIYELIDLISGKTLISGKGFRCIEAPGSAVYVHTRNENNDWEIYVVK